MQSMLYKTITLAYGNLPTIA